MSRTGRSDIRSAIDDSYGTTIFSHGQRNTGIDPERGWPPPAYHSSPRKGPWNANSTSIGSAIDDNCPTIWEGLGPESVTSTAGRDTKAFEPSLLKKLMKASVDSRLEAKREKEAERLTPPNQAPSMHESVRPRSPSPPRFVLPKHTPSNTRSEKQSTTPGEMPIQTSAGFEQLTRDLNERRDRENIIRQQLRQSHRRQQVSKPEESKDVLRVAGKNKEKQPASVHSGVRAQWEEFKEQQEISRRASNAREAAEALMAGALLASVHQSESRHSEKAATEARIESTRLPLSAKERVRAPALSDKFVAASDMFGMFDETPLPEQKSQRSSWSTKELRNAVENLDANGCRSRAQSNERDPATRSPSQHRSTAATSAWSEKSSQTNLSMKSLREAVERVDANSQLAGRKKLHIEQDAGWSGQDHTSLKAGTQRSLRPTVETLSEISKGRVSERPEQDNVWGANSAKSPSDNSWSRDQLDPSHRGSVHDDPRQTQFAGAGWISPHPLSVLSSGHPSHPQTSVELPDGVTGATRRLTHEEWLRMQKVESLAKVSNRSQHAASRQPSIIQADGTSSQRSASTARQQVTENGTTKTVSEHRSSKSSCSFAKSGHSRSQPSGAQSRISKECSQGHVQSDQDRGNGTDGQQWESKVSQSRRSAISRSGEDLALHADEAADAYAEKLNNIIDGEQLAPASSHRSSSEELRLRMPWDGSTGSRDSQPASIKFRPSDDKPRLVRQDTASETESSGKLNSARRSTHYHVHYHLPPRPSSSRQSGSQSSMDRATGSSLSQSTIRSKSSHAASDPLKDVPLQSIEVSDTGKGDLYIPPQYRVGSVSSTTWQDLEDMEKGRGKFQPKSKRR